MKKGVRYLMYGTKDTYINADGYIFDSDGRIIHDPWRNRSFANTPVPSSIQLMDGHDKPCGHRLTLGEALMFTFYGLSICPIIARYDDEPATLSNIAYRVDGIVATLRVHQEAAVLHLANGQTELFKTMHHTSSSRGHGVWSHIYYINQYGLVLDLTMSARGQMAQFLPWVYYNAYPHSAATGCDTAIHELVYRIWVSNEEPNGRIVHHKDECLWNPSKDNLALITRSEHALIHDSPRHTSEITMDKIEKAFQMIMNNDHIDDIVLMLTGGRSDLRTSALNIVKRILHNPKSYAAIRANYDISGYQGYKGKKIDEAAVERICQLLATNDPRYTDLYLGEKTGFSPTFIRQIRTNTLSNKTAMAIRAKYADAIDPKPRSTGHFAKGLTPEQVHSIIWLCKCSNLTNDNIGMLFNIAGEVVRYIRTANPKGAYYNIVKEPVKCHFSDYDRKFARKREGVQMVDDSGHHLTDDEIIDVWCSRLQDPMTHNMMTPERAEYFLNELTK